MPTKVWKNAVIGVGVVGDWHVNVLTSATDNAELLAVCDLQPDNPKTSLANRGKDVPIYTSLDELFNKHPDLEVCHICTPSGDHLDPAIACMQAGKNVICEKPMEITPARVDAMIAAAAEHKVKLAGIFQNRWREENRAIKKAVDEGRFGTIAYAGCYTPWWRSDDYYRSGDWRGTWKLDGGGAIMNQSVHYIDMLQWLAGPIKSVSAYASARVHADVMEVEDTLCASCTFESGAHGLILGTTAMFPGVGQRVEIGGPDGMVMTAGMNFARFRGADDKSVDKSAEFFTAKDQSSGGGTSATDVPHYLHARNIHHILDAWSKGDEAETYGPEARKAVAIIAALYESARQQGQPVQVS